MLKMRNYIDLECAFISETLVYFQKCQNTIQMLKYICTINEEGSVHDWMCQKWFAKFPGEEFSLKDVPCSVIPVGIDNNHIKILPDNNQHYITSEITYSKY